jgi:alpha-tubulin suppressor-like RCC1 family protein
VGPVPTPFQVPLPSAIVSISAGYYFSLAIDVNGTIWSWGEKQLRTAGARSDL